jgi:ribonuclease BN (tRNA processing enzyme)
VRLRIVGCSGSFPGPESPASSYLIEADDDERTWRVVIDLGSGALGPLQRFVKPDEIDAVVISHLHPDHFMDLCGLYVARHYCPGPALPDHGERASLPLFGPEGTVERLVQAYGPDAAEDMPKVYDVTTLTDGGQFTVGPIRITTRLVRHPVPAFGIRIEHDGQVIAYSGDTDTCDSLIELARDADLLLAEASFEEGRDLARGIHLTGRRAGEAATAAGARRLLLTHIPVWTDIDTVLGEAKEAYLGPVEAATAGAGYVLDGVRVR